MATTVRGQKSAFLLDLFRGNPKVNYQGANQAWQAAGNEGELSSNTFYNAKTAFKKLAGDGTPGIADLAPMPKKSRSRASKGTGAGRTTEKSSAPENGQVVATAPENGRSVTPEPLMGHEATPTGDRDRVFDEVEAGIDNLIFRLKLAGGAPEVEARLREVRRSLHPSQR